MAIYDYTDQFDEDVNIADPNPGNEVSYEYKLVDSIGKEPDQSLIYYTKNSLTYHSITIFIKNINYYILKSTIIYSYSR